MAEVLEATVISRIDYGIAKAELTSRVDADLQITIDGVGDKAGYKLADTRRREYVKLRNSIDKRRKELNTEAREHIKRVNDSAEDLQQIISEGETHVTRLVDEIDAEIEKAAQDKLDAVYNARNEKLIAAGLIVERILVDSLTDEQIDAKIADAVELAALRKAQADREAEAKAETDRLAAEAAERNKKEAEKLAAERRKFEQDQAFQLAENRRLEVERESSAAKEREELNRQRAEQQEAQAKIDAANEAIRKAESDRLAEIERINAETAAKERQVEVDRLAAIEHEKIIKAAEERIELARQHAEAVKPDKDKLRAFVIQLDAVALPKCSKAGAEMLQEVRCVVREAIKEIRAIIEA